MTHHKTNFSGRLCPLPSLTPEKAGRSSGKSAVRTLQPAGWGTLPSAILSGMICDTKKLLLCAGCKAGEVLRPSIPVILHVPQSADTQEAAFSELPAGPCQ